MRRSGRGCARRTTNRCLAAVPLLLALNGATAPLSAQAVPERADTIPIIALDTLRITVTRGLRTLLRTPAAVSAVDAAMIGGAQPGLSLEESLRRVPGIMVDNRHNYSLGDRIAIRGFGTRAAFGVRGVRVLADGIPLTAPDGQSNLNAVDLGSAGRIEVIRGPASSLYGNAAGGVVAIFTEEPPPGAFSAALRTSFGDQAGGLGELGAMHRVQVKAGGRSERGSYLVALSRLDGSGHREHAAFRQTLLNSLARVMVGANQLTMVLNIVDVPLAQNPGALPLDSARLKPGMAWPRNVATGTGQTTRQYQGGLTWSAPARGGRTDAAIYGVRREVLNPLPFPFPQAIVIDLERTSGGVRLTHARAARLAGRALDLTAGFDVEAQRDERRELDNDGGQPGERLRKDQRDEVAALAPFTELTLAVGPATAVSVGARYDLVHFRTADRFLEDGDDSGRRTLTALSPSIGLVHRLGSAGRTVLFANAATAFQTPTTTELINAPPPPSEPCCPGGFNAQLQPQRALSFETGVRTPIAGAQLEASVYAMHVRDALVSFQIEDVPGREFFRNAGRSRLYGAELSAAATPIAGVLDASIAYTFNDLRFMDAGLDGAALRGNRMPGVPPHRLLVAIGVRAGDALRLELDAEHTAAFHVTDANDPRFANPAATVLHLRALGRTTFARSGVRPFVSIANLTNTRYHSAVVVNAAAGRYFEPAPGRTIIVGLEAAVGDWLR